jgi:hypothetical protein
MSAHISIEMETSRHLSLPTQRTISADDARQGPMGHQLLYVLAIGTTGAAFAIGIVLAYFELFRLLN